MNLLKDISRIKKVMGVITETKNEKLKKYKAIKEVADSFDYSGLIKLEFDVDYNNVFGYYRIHPTFRMDYWKMTVPERRNTELLKNVMSLELCQRLEDYLGIHAIPGNTKIEVIKS